MAVFPAWLNEICLTSKKKKTLIAYTKRTRDMLGEFHGRQRDHINFSYL
jgi:hypothetical protein